MANLFQAWDEDIQALGAAKASDDQIEARRQQLAEHFKAKAKAAGLSSKKIYETLDQFDAYSRQKTTAQDNQLTPEEQEMAQRVKDGTTRTGAIKEVGKRFKDVGLGVVSSLTRMGGDVAQTWADVGDNDKSELSSQVAQGLYNATDDIRSNYSEGTKQAKKDFWSPAGLTMGVSENAGQIAGSAALLGTGGALAGAAGITSKAGKLATMAGMAAPLAYSQGYGQGKENSLDEINKTSNAQLWENVKAEAKAYDDAGGTGEVPYLVKQFKEAGGDLNLMKDLMAENAGNVTGLMTVATEPLAMGVGSLMSRGAAAGGTGLLAKATNWMNNQGMSNELARRIAAGASAAEARKAGQVVATSALRDNASIASQAAKVVAMQGGREGFQETGQEGGEGYIAKTEGSLAAGRKGELNRNDWTGDNGNGIVQQGLQGGAIGLLMGAGGAGATLRNSSKLALEKKGLPEKHDAAIIAKKQADAALAKAANIADANPNNIDAQKAYADALDTALVATNDLDQLSAKFNALYTPEEQAVIKAATMEGVAARKKVADDAAKAQKELDDAQAKAAQEQQAQQAEILKAQRDEVISRLVPMLGDDVAVSNELASLGLSDTEANTLLTDAHKEAKAQKKAQKKGQQQTTPKTPFELAVDEAFNAKGERNNVGSQDIADKHGIKNIKTLIDAISERIDSNAAKTKAAANEALAQKRQADKQQAEVLSEKQQLENTLADFAANNDHDSMVNFLRDYDPKEADTLIANAYKTVANRTKAEQDAITATKQAEAAKAKKAENDKQAEQKKIAFNNDMADLYAANPDRNPTKAELDSVGKKHGVKSPIELAKAWVKAKNEAKATKEALPKLGLPSPETATKDTQDVTIPTGLNINRDNIENQDRRPIIVRSNGQPFQTQEAAEQALKNKSTKKPRKNESPITSDTHEVIPVDGGFAIAPVVEIQQPKKPDDNEDGGVIADAPKPNAPVSPSGGTIPRAHLNGISEKLKDGKTVEEIATRIQKRLPHLTIEDVTQQVLAEQAKASKPATLDSVIGKYSDDEEVDAEIRQSGEVLKQFLPETIDDWKIDKSTFAVRGAWSVSYTKPYIVTDRKTGKEVVNSTTSSAPLDSEILLSGDEQAIKDHIKERLTKNGITPRGVKNWQLDDAVSPTGQQAADTTPTKPVEDDGIKTKHIKQPKPADRTVYPHRDDLLTAIAKMKGLNKAQAIYHGIKDSLELNKRGRGLLGVFKEDGRGFDVIARELSDMGYPVNEGGNTPYDNINGTPTPDALLDALRKALFGEDVGTEEYILNKYAAQREADQKEAEEMERLFNGKGSSSWDEADALDNVSDAIVNDITNVISTVAPEKLSETLKEVSNEPIIEIGGQAPNVKTEARSPQNGDAETTGNGKTGQQESQSSTGQDSGIGLNPSFNLNAQTNEELAKRDADNKASEAKRQAEEKAAKDKAQADKEVSDFRLSGSNAPADIAMAGGQKDMFAPPTRGEREAEKAQTGRKEAQEIGDAEFDERMKELGYQEQEQIIEHVTAKGKTLRGVVRDISFAEAKSIDKFTFKKNGGYFIREEYLAKSEPVKTEQAQDKSVQNNEPAPTKKPETKTETRGKVNFSSLTTESEVVAAWMSLKKGDIITTIVGGRLIAQTDFKNYPNMRFHRVDGSEVASNIGAISGFPSAHIALAAKLKEQSKNELVKKLIGKTPEGKDLYEDGRGVRFTDNGRGVQVGEDVAITMQNGKTVYDVSGRTDEHRTVEEVAARQPKPQPKEEKPAPIKQQTKKESRLIEIDDEIDAAAKKLADVFKNMGKGTLNSGVDPVIIGKVLAIGVELSTLYLNKGAVKFSIWAENIINSLSKNGVPQDIVQPYLKRLYFASKADVSSEIRKQMDNDDDVIDFDFATLNVGQQQTKGKANELPQLDSTSTKSLEGVSANDVQGIGSQRSTGGKASGGSGTNLSGNERTGGAGLSTTRIMGDDTGEVSDTARGKGTERLAVTPAQDIATDFVITDEDNIGGGGLKTKYRNNVAAIRVLKQVESEGREATNEEQKILAKWVGWGSLYQAFRYSDGSIAKGWDKEVKELAELLTPEEMTAAVDSSVAAHYTSPKVVEAMWKAVQQLGFKNGKVLEPSVGSGNFFGAMPAKLRNSALLHGVELDNITGGIAKLLYPKAKIKAAMGFQDYTIPDGYFDLVIGNPPFGKWPITDKTRRHLDGFSIHNYFFAKSIDALREGGVLAMVVTNRLMDASNANDKARQYIDEHAELLGAIRLPNNAFLKNAGTQVTTDIIFLRKRVAGEDITTNKWMNVRQYKDKNGKTVPLNEYFHAHPEMMLGEFGAYGSMYTPDDPALVARDGQDTLSLLNDAIAKLPKSVMPTVEQKSEEMAEKTAKDIPDVKVGSMFVENGDIYIRQQDSLGERQADVVTLSGKAVDRVKGMISIRDAFILVRDAQLSPNKDSELPSLRKKLNVAYDSFVKTNGFINDDANKRLMRDDPSWPQLSALEEKYDKGLSAAVAKTTGEVVRPVSASKAAIFNVRTQFPYATITSVSSAKDGYVESLNRYGKLDIDFVANLYGQSVGDTITELGNLIYQDPVRGWVTSSDYLSGNVKLKLQAAKLSLKAQEAAKGELEALPPIEQLHRGITALEAVIPEDIESVDIDIRAGAHWLPPKHIADFAREMLGINGNVGATYNKFDASWSVDFNQSNISAAKKTEWSTDRKTAAQILNAALNHKQATVYDKHDDGTTTVNVEATAEANEKVANLKRAWADWIWHDDNRRVELSRLYNDTFNTDAPTVFDGQHLTLAGKIDDDVLRLRPHQKDGIWRITQSDSTLLDHVVGAGKTFTMIGGAMELRRMGKSNKPMFVVPNHLVGQWAADFTKLYPSANILAATKADFEAKNRKKLFARIATGDWDAVIVAHSSFGKVSLHPDEEAKFIKKEIEEMMEAEALARKEGGEKARNAKDIGKRRLAKEDKLKKLLATKNKDDDNVYWSELGVDSLFVDEAHEFKNLAFTSTIQRVAGLGNQAGSQKATDLFTKIVSLKDRVAGAKVVFATGTPISNTMAEMYTMQRYLDLERMVHQGTVLFDAWARTFGEVVSDWELSPAGKYKMNSRFAKFVNMPELMQGYLSFADVINRDDINRQLAARGETLGTPKIRTGKPQNIVVERSQDQADYIGEASIDSNGNESYPEGSLVYRAENIPKKQEKGADNMLKIMSDARKAALDMRLIDPSLPDNPNSKVNEAIRRILTTYRQWNDDKGVQLVFCDLSTPKGAIAQEKARIEELVRLADEGDEAAIKELDEMSPDELDALNSSFSVYDDMKAKLIAQGIPANQVAFIHDAKTDIQKEALFGKVRSGQIRVLIGSTAKMGAGMNVQDRLVALHHLDAPWRPSDLEQREGRIIRQGNVFYKRDPEGFEVDIERYATKQTLDSRMWQTLEGKARFIEQIRKGDIKSRSVEDIGGEAANAAEMKAASSGNPLILEEMTLRREVQNLEAEKQRHVREQHRLKGTTKKLQEDNEYLEQRVAKMEADVKSKTPEEFEMTVGRKVFKQGEEKARERAGKALSDAAKDIYIKGESRVVGKFGDFDIIARLSLFGSTTFSVEAKSGLNYGEFSFDAENDSLSGLTLKIANAANSVEGLLDRAKATIDSNNKEIPKVEALLSNWKDSAKLDAARKKHTEVIDQLKPKEKVKVDDVKSDEQTKTIKPKFSRGTGEGLTTTQTRAILVKYFGEKVIKALESSGLLTIMATPPSWAEPDADGAYDKDSGKAYLFTDNLSAETVVATLAHELSGHKGFQELMTPTAYASLMRQFNRLVNQGNAIALAAKARAEAAEVVTPTADTKEAIALAEKQTLQRQQDELLPYLLTQQATLNATRSQQSAVTKVIEQVYRAVKAWLYRTLSAKGYDGLASKLLQPKDITLLAERMIREMGNGTEPTSNKAKVSQFSQLNTPQSQINAVRRKYEGTSQWMKAPNGQPTKLNEMQWLQVRTPNFKAWFGDWENDAKNASKVVDANGEPMVMYHGSKATDIVIFDTSSLINKGSYFTQDPTLAQLYANDHLGKVENLKNGGVVYPVFLSIKSPLILKREDKGFWAAVRDRFKKDYKEAKLAEDRRINASTFLSALAVEKLRNDSLDGIINIELNETIAFDPTQIKSAIGNTGEFNQTNPDIRFSRKAKNPITEGIKSAANDAKNSLPDPIAKSIDNFMAGRILPSSDMANITAKTELGIYKRTIGTQLNTALQLPDFKKVYDMAQRYLQHVAVDAYAALKVAPNLLGKLESWSDLKKDVKKIWPANFIKQKADRAAVASIIFDETLNNELLSDADILKALTRDQRQIYKEARDAIQVSLENTAKSEMVRKLLAAEAINWETVESLINQELPVEQFAQTVRDMVESRIGGFKNELEAILDADPKIKEAFKTGNKNKLIPAQKKELKKALTLKAQIETTEEALKSLNDVEKRLDTLIEQGYAPLMRFGEYTLTVRDLDGKVKSFFMFESKSEQVRAVNAIVARYGKTVNLETDMVSKEEFKQFAGMTPETMALFAKETGMDKDEAYQHYLKLAIPARSAMTRMIKRKGTEGFSDDIQRVAASFVMSNARMSAKNIYAAQIEKSIQDIESGKSVKDQAIVMKENVFNPKENFAQLRNFLFLWNLGGSIFFGLLNMTQPYMQTLPHLSQYVPIGDATRAILRGSKIAGVAMKNGTAPKGYEAEYNRAVREGVVDPQNVFMLSGVERGKTGASNSAWGVITHTMGLIAQVTESFNRKAVFIASLQVAKQKGDVWLKKKGFNSAYDFAKDSVDQTQGRYDKANRSNWANTSVGAPLMVFKQFSINYVEQMVRMWKKEAASGDEGKKAVFLMLAMLASLSGMMGLPFIKDILDVSETTAAFLGNPVNIEREARLALGKDLADPLFNGVLNHFVFNNLGMDIQSRTGMGDLVPLSNALNPTLSAQGRINEFASIGGATGGLIEKGYDATQLIARGNIGTAALTLMPRSFTSAFTGGKMAVTDEVMDSKGNKLFDTTWDEGLVKFIDANPKRMADLSRTRGLEGKDKAIQAYMTTNFRQKIINAIMDDDKAEVNELMAKVKAWNEARPRYPVFINLNTLSENANKKEQTFDARESIPKGMDWMKNERPEM